MTTEPRNGVYRTTDLSIAGYLVSEGAMQFHSARRVGRGPMDFRIVLLDPDGIAPGLIAKYPGSEAARFDAAVRGIKKVLHEIGR